MKSRLLRVIYTSKLLLLTITLSLILTSNLFAQNTDDFNFSEPNELTIEGTIYNEYTNEPIPFVNMVIRNTLTGTATDEDGHFILRFPEEFIANTLFVSVIGFSAKTFKLSELTKVDDIVIELKPTNYEIVSISIEAESKVLFGHIKKALQSIGQNYIDQPFQYNFIYKNKYIAGARNRVTDSKGFITDTKGYAIQSPTQLFKSRSYKFTETKRNYKEVPYQNGLTNMDELLKYDIVRSQTSVFSGENIDQYQLELLDSEPYDEDTLLHIAFKNLTPDLNTTNDAYIKYYEGELFLLKNQNVLVKCIIHGSSAKKSIYGKSFYVNGNNDLLGDDVQYTATISYHNQGDKYHLSSINLSESFVTLDKLKGKSVTQLIIPDHELLNATKKTDTRDYFNNPDGY